MLLVFSESTEQYIGEWGPGEKKLVTGPPTADLLKERRFDRVVAVGGGAVIDTAKILCEGSVLAVPTTLSGASRTSHAVYWDEGRKHNQATEKPITVFRPGYLVGLPEETLAYSRVDCLCHALESLVSVRRTEQSQFYAQQAVRLASRGVYPDLLNASLLAGDAIEITGTNLIHALSYAITATHQIPHAKALSFLLPRLLPFFLRDADTGGFTFLPHVDLAVDVECVVPEALSYPKATECEVAVSENRLKEVLA